MERSLDEKSPEATASRDALEAPGHEVSPSDIAVGVIIGRTSEFFDFFVFAIAAVIVFPARLFPFLSPLEGVLASFGLLALAFVVRPLGTVAFTLLDRRLGRLPKLTLALFLLGVSTVGMGLVPGFDSAGWWAVAAIAVLRIGQGLAVGGAWDGLAPLLSVSAGRRRRGFYAMVPQLGAPIGLAIATLVFAYLLAHVSEADFLDWGWRYPFFVAFSLNVVALFARLRIVAAPEIAELLDRNELAPSGLRQTLAEDGRKIVLAVFVPLGTFAMFHMVTIFPLSWVFLYTDRTLEDFLVNEAAGSVLLLATMVAGGLLADRMGRKRILGISAAAIALFAILAPVLLAAGREGELVYMLVGFAILGFGLAVSSGAVADIFAQRNRYTASALVSSLSWMFGAGFAPVTALFLSNWLGLWAAGLYLLSGAVATLVALLLVRGQGQGMREEV
ncbi:MFS transporter [Frigidibacter oleivorans]|uniref:MFS transporter n=1 Tax=Frigidibacter oleivorans TaxID=2487129 RepID=UPI001F2D367A|nr:MFS transporter [Frigidibacter oleivorans]